MPFIMERKVQLMMMLVLQQLWIVSAWAGLVVSSRWVLTYVTVLSMVPSALASLGINSVPIQAMVATPVE